MEQSTTVGRSVAAFNDDWLFVPHQVDPAHDAAVFDADAEPVTLPHTWNVDGGRRGFGSYARQFAHTADGRRTWIEFRGVNASADVYLNGTLMAHHDGGYSTFRVDLTDALASDNLLVVVVDNGQSETVYPQWADFTFYGGLYREVFLIRVPAAHLRLDDQGGPGLIVTPHFDGPDARVHLRALVTGGEGVRFGIDGVGSTEALVIDGVAEATLTIPDVRRWDGLADPHLYIATAELWAEGQPTDRVEVRFGCRTMEVDPARGFLLNGEPYPLRGVSRHQDREGVGNALTRAHMDEDLAIIREIGATSVRLAHYQHDQYFYDLCDGAGLVVWAEVPQITRFMPTATPNATSQLVELVTQNRHHASIACWALSNEITIAGHSDEVLRTHREQHGLVRELDPSRPTAMAHAFLLETDDPLVTVADLMAYNLYYGWYVGEIGDNDAFLDAYHAAHPDTPIGLTEYGADANPRFQTGTPERGDYTEQYQAAYHEHMLDLIEERPWLWATYVWNLFDFGADGRDEGGAPGRNQKGLVTWDRTLRKDAFYLYKAAWSSEPFVHVAGRRYVDRPEPVTTVSVYSNADQVTLWCDGVEVGTKSGRCMFRFEVPLNGEHELVARAGEAADAITVRRVAEPNPDYRLAEATVTNWFETAELPSPAGFFSVNDTLADIKTNPAGRALMDQLMAAAAASRGEVAQNVEIPAAMQAMVDRMTVRTLLKQAGGTLTGEQVGQLNAALNQIAK